MDNHVENLFGRAETIAKSVTLEYQELLIFYLSNPDEEIRNEIYEHLVGFCERFPNLRLLAVKQLIRNIWIHGYTRKKSEAVLANLLRSSIDAKTAFFVETEHQDLYDTRFEMFKFIIENDLNEIRFAKFHMRSMLESFDLNGRNTWPIFIKKYHPNFDFDEFFVYILEWYEQGNTTETIVIDYILDHVKQISVLLKKFLDIVKIKNFSSTIAYVRSKFEPQYFHILINDLYDAERMRIINRIKSAGI